MDIKRMLISFCCIFAVCTVVVTGIISVSKKSEEDRKRSIDVVNGQQIEIYKKEKNEEGTGYLVKANGETLAVFDLIDPEEPIQTTDIYIDTLRNYDRELVEKGITVYTEEALCLILEDFGS